MITDKLAIFDEAVAITDTKVGGDYINLGSATEIAKGEPIYLNVWVDTAFTTSTVTDGLVVDLIGSSAAPDADDKILEILPLTAPASLGTTGLLAKVALPQNMDKKYINVNYTVDTTSLAAGKVSTFLTLG